MHKPTGSILPHVFKDVFFRTMLSAEFPLLNTVVQIAECDRGPLVLDIHF